MLKTKVCFKCKKEKTIDNFYKHPKMTDGFLGKCKECTKKDSATGIHEIVCKVCGKKFFTSKGELTSRNGKRGTGRKTCSRKCWYIWNRGKNTYNFKGENAGYMAKHKWINQQKGDPRYCEKCKSTKEKAYHWSNISGRYLKDFSDWQRLCVSCHKKYDLEKARFLIVNCVVCGKPVKTKSKRRKFCSNSCSNKFYRK